MPDSCRLRFRVVAVAMALCCGCGSNSTEKPNGDSTQPPTAASTKQVEADNEENPAPTATKPAKRFASKFQPVQLDGGSSAGGTPSANASGPGDEQRVQSVITALQPFQILLGKWRWVTQKKFSGFPKNGEDLEWVWDFQADRRSPALSAHSDAHPYFHSVAITYLPQEDQFQLLAESPEGKQRTLRGKWTADGEPQEVSDGKKLQRTYKLELTQVEPIEGEQWQLTLAQLDNNQYLTSFKRSAAAGKPFAPLDTVRQQRVGTSFAVAGSDNPGPKCIISGGLGTSSVSYKGQSYPVCCSGCAAAFNDDPERWLAKLAKEKAEKALEDE